MNHFSAGEARESSTFPGVVLFLALLPHIGFPIHGPSGSVDALQPENESGRAGMWRCERSGPTALVGPPGEFDAEQQRLQFHFYFCCICDAACCAGDLGFSSKTKTPSLASTRVSRSLTRRHGFLCFALWPETTAGSWLRVWREAGGVGGKNRGPCFRLGIRDAGRPAPWAESKAKVLRCEAHLSVSRSQNTGTAWGEWGVLCRRTSPLHCA